MIKCETRTSLYTVKCKWQPGSVDVVIILEMPSLYTLFLCSAGEQAWLCS